ncbi:MSHA pilin protein MshC [Sulfuritortus calidifontis]|uniref:Type II secretion system protein H n=1 Tax=Sulfuritortus calidifontis TaxID=1914471 RepID=A0A4R3JXS3_9PROT|nr:type II secretion system protein [Sulfuritortus calidifontis]TCS71887.1 MSHA pilin protein MshC [Sulfuritortus calidifontis]
MTGRESGYSLIELVGVLALLGILAAVGLSRFTSTETFAARGFYDEAANFLRYAQKQAIARHGAVAVQLIGNGLSLQGAPGPAGEAPYQIAAPGGVSLAATVSSLSFDALGRPSTAAVFTFTEQDGLVRSLTVHAETGYVQ